MLLNLGGTAFMTPRNGFFRFGLFIFIRADFSLFFKKKGHKEMRKELAKNYAPREFEDRIYKNWCDKN